MMIKKNHGQSLIEFAIFVPVALTLIFGSVDLGIAFYHKTQINQAVVAGARLAAIQSSPNDNQVIGAIQGIASFVATGDITINRSYTIQSANDAVEVKITNTHTFITHYVPGSSVILTARMSMLIEDLS